MESLASMPVTRLSTGMPFAEVAAIVGASIAPEGVRGWRLRPRGHAVEVLVDDRLLDAGSSQRRLVSLASGAALYNLRLALAQAGHEVVVVMRPGPPEILATAQAIETSTPQVAPPLPDDDELAARHTLRSLAAAAEAEGAVLVSLREGVLVLASLDETVGALVRCGQAMQRIVIEAALRSVGLSLAFEPFADAGARQRAVPACSGAFPQVLVELS
jgi:hypothetical protein